MAPDAEHIDSCLNASCDAGAPAEAEGNWVGDGGNGLRGSPCQAAWRGLNRKPSAAPPLLLLLSQKAQQKERGALELAGPGTGLGGPGGLP